MTICLGRTKKGSVPQNDCLLLVISCFHFSRFFLLTVLNGVEWDFHPDSLPFCVTILSMDVLICFAFLLSHLFMNQPIQLFWWMAYRHSLCFSFYGSIQIVAGRFLQRSTGSDVLATKQALLYIILLQYIPRFVRVIPLTSELKRTTGVFAETAWAGAASYLLLYMLASHVSYLLSCRNVCYLFC